MNWSGFNRHQRMRWLIRKLRSPRLPLQRLWSAMPAAARWMDRFSTPRKLYGPRPTPGVRTVVIVSHELTATGAPKVLVEVARACIASGRAVVVVSPSDGPYRDIFVASGATVVIADRVFKEECMVDVLATAATCFIFNTIATDAAVGWLRDRVPTIWYLHENLMIRQMLDADPTLAQRMRGIARVWAASDLTAARVAEAGATGVVLRGSCEPLIDDASPGEPFSSAGTVDMVLMASIDERKGQDILIQAIGLLPPETRPLIRVRLYGKKYGERYFASVQRDLAVVPEVTYEGGVDPAEAARIITRSDILIVPSRDDPLPLVAVEAMSAGRVVICSTRCGVSQYLEDGFSAFIAADCSPPAIAETIVRAVAARENWAGIGEAGRNAYAYWFSPEKFGRQVRETLDEIESGNAFASRSSSVESTRPGRANRSGSSRK